jgi:transcription initiation factor IIE alpha subunit
MLLPTLSDTEKKVLMALLERNNIAGYDLMSMTSSSFNELRDAVASLRRNDLIQVVGSSSTEKDFQFSRFAVLPSAKSFVNALTR